MRRYALLLAALSVSAAIGIAYVFGGNDPAEEAPAMIDVRSRPSPAEWIEPSETNDFPFDLTAIPPREIQITSLNGEKFEVRPRRIYVSTSQGGTVVDSIDFLFEKVSRDDAVAQVRELSQKIGLPADGFKYLDRWAATSKTTPIYVNSPLGSDTGISVGIRQSFDVAKPYFVILSISWGFADLKAPAVFESKL